MKILHCPTDTGGNPIGLARAERGLGADSTAAVFSRSWPRYPVDIDLHLDGRSRLGRLPGRVRFAASAMRTYDVFHFNFGQTLLPMLGPLGVDLPLLRRLGKRVFVTFQGDDARPRSAHAALPPRPAWVQHVAERRRAWRVAYARRHAHRVFCVNPDLLRYVEGAEFVPYACVDPAAVEVTPPLPAGRLVVAHAPTDRAIKGTEQVLDAADTLGDADFEWMFVEGVPHEEAMRRLRRADVIIDQLRVGWYGGLSVEMMAMGKPVVCYVRDEDLRSVPAEMAAELPIVRATPESLTDVIAGLASARDRLREIGGRSRQFVETWHDPRRIAHAMLTVYRDPSVRFWDAF